MARLVACDVCQKGIATDADKCVHCGSQYPFQCAAAGCNVVMSSRGYPSERISIPVYWSYYGINWRLMKTIKGHYNGSVVVLDEPAPVDGNAEVIVQFPDAAPAQDVEPASVERRHWNNARELYLRFAGTASNEVLCQRGHFSVTPSGLPEHLPTDEEWKERAARASRMLEEWAAEDAESKE